MAILLNLVKHWHNVAAANSVQLTRRRQYVASKPVLDYPVDIIQAACKNSTRIRERRCLAEQKLDLAKNPFN